MSSNAFTAATVFSIDIARNTAACPPATRSIKTGGRLFFPLQLNIVGEALDAGLFYQDALRDACKDAWEAAFPVVDVCVTEKDGRKWVEMGDFADQRELKARLTGTPRGTWALQRKAWKRDDETHVIFYPLVSDGFGGVYESHSSHRATEPSHADICADLVGMDIYLARQAEETRREAFTSAAIIRERGWRAGVQLKGVKLGSHSRDEYSSATITECFGETVDGPHLVKLLLTKRGSRKRYTWTGTAQWVNVAGAAPAQPPGGTLTVTKIGGDLFADAA